MLFYQLWTSEFKLCIYVTNYILLKLQWRGIRWRNICRSKVWYKRSPNHKRIFYRDLSLFASLKNSSFVHLLGQLFVHFLVNYGWPVSGLWSLVPSQYQAFGQLWLASIRLLVSYGISCSLLGRNLLQLFNVSDNSFISSDA